MGEGTRLYVRIITTGLHQHEPSIRNLFVSFFAACDPGAVSVHWARLVFDRIQNPSTFIFNTMIRVSYSAMISRYVSNGRFMEALRLFQDMQMGRVEPNDSVLVSVISASPNLGFLDTSRWVHYYIRNKKKNENMDCRTRTALIDMYCKCGSVGEGLRVFSDAKEKAQTAEWTAMITGLAMHGESERAIQLFDEMTQSGTKPNTVTFAELLSACSLGGLVGDGLRYFLRMEADFGIKPTVQHVACVVDLLGRAGLIDVAMAFMDRYRYGVKSNAAMWVPCLPLVEFTRT